MALQQPDPAKANPKYATTYQGSRGGWFPKPETPTIPKENRS